MGPPRARLCRRLPRATAAAVGRPLLLLLLLLASAPRGGRASHDGGRTDSTSAAAAADGVHPWSRCGAYCGPDQLCGHGDFCPFDGGGAEDSVCAACPDASAGERCADLMGGLPEEGLDECSSLCESGLDGSECSAEAPCAVGRFFCDYLAAPEGGGGGTCRPCPADVNECVAGGEGDMFIASDLGRKSCVECELYCDEIQFSDFTVDGNLVESAPILWAARELPMSASGPLIECSDLILPGVDICPGADGHICLVEDYTLDSIYWELSNKAEASGCVALIMFGLYGGDAESFSSSNHNFDDLAIPFVDISYNDGKRLVENELGSIANVTVQFHSDFCWKGQRCTENIPCFGDTYCDFKQKHVDGEYYEGYCWDCPTDDDGQPDPLACFFDRQGGGYTKDKREVESCASNCAASMNFGTCKFCPQDVTGFEFGVENESDRCSFCPRDDVQYPDREVPLFGEGVMCWQMQSFFGRLQVHKDSQNCRLAQAVNYICGCQGTGYGGADTETKKALLAWLPRTMALLSLMGSSFIAFDSFNEKAKRIKVFNQLVFTLSIFDILGSCAYALTTIPIPASDYIYGSHGNEATCVAQGFFIQLGTVACFLNVSLAVYYLLVIKYGWSEEKVKTRRLWLFVPPVLVGLGFACAGIPFYDNMILWCNNAASWWPDIPVAVAIFASTGIMGTVCWDVHQKEKVSAKWRSAGRAQGAAQGGGSQNTLSKRVFWQSFWYLVAFYMTWPPYLALQYMWASGKAFSMYGFILFSGTMVPLQGLWNFFVYVRPRHLKRLRRRASENFSMSLGGSLTPQRVKSAIFSRKRSTQNLSSANVVSQGDLKPNEPSGKSTQGCHSKNDASGESKQPDS